MALLFGEIILKLGYVTTEQLKEAIEIQKIGRAMVGQVLRNLNMLTDSQVDEILAYQRTPKGKGKMFGDCAVELGLVSFMDLAEAIRYQITSRGFLGDILVRLGYITPEQRDEAIRRQLKEQNRHS
ncbi:MAG TPA: hypothetical protein ENL08_01420 [Bacteroidetes bacterium]|nr:hypothetical protein [Bacteroidota bacterium]